MLANGSFPELRLQLISPSVHIYNTPTHDPVATCVIPAGLPYTKKAAGSGKPHTDSSGNAGKDQTPPEKSKTSDDPNDTQEPGQWPPNLLSSFPPDESPALTKTLSNGQVRKFAGIVTLVHVPSLPLRNPSRFPLDNPTPAVAEAPTAGAGDPKPQLYGLGTINPGLIERNNPPPIVGWALDVPLDDDDVKYESQTTSRVGDEMQIDEAVYGNTRGSKGKEKAREIEEREIEEPIKVRLQAAAMGMGGKVIVVIGTRGRIWVYRIRSGLKRN